MPPDMLHGRYELRRPLGSGGMADVWEGYDRVLERVVAVKTVDLHASDDPTLGERLQREAVATAALVHPDVVTVHDAGVEGSRVYFVMELMAGQDLGAVLRGGPLPIDEAVRVAGRVCGALAAAHRAGIVHRDVKPANVVVDGQAVTVVDFGIAAMARAAGASLTAPGTVLGTAAYMAPEQAAGTGASAASDMYAVGCLLTAMVTGRPPFVGDDPLQVLGQHVAADPPHLRDLRPEVPVELDRLVGELLVKDPARRPSAAEAEQRLTAIAAGTAMADGTAMAGGLVGATRVLPAAAPTVVLGAQELPDAGRRARRRRAVMGVLAGALVLALAVVLAAWTPWRGDEPSQQDPVAGEPADGQRDAAGEPGSEQTDEPSADDTQEASAEDVTTLLVGLDLDESTRADLVARWAEVSALVAEGDQSKAVRKASELTARLDELVRDGVLTRDAADAVVAAMTAVLGDLAAGGDGKGEKDDEDDKEEKDDKGKGKGKDKDD